MQQCRESRHLIDNPLDDAPSDHAVVSNWSQMSSRSQTRRPCFEGAGVLVVDLSGASKVGMDDDDGFCSVGAEVEQSLISAGAMRHQVHHGGGAGQVERPPEGDQNDGHDGASPQRSLATDTITHMTG